jgi:hypothetical protein
MFVVQTQKLFKDFRKLISGSLNNLKTLSCTIVRLIGGSGQTKLIQDFKKPILFSSNNLFDPHPNSSSVLGLAPNFLPHIPGKFNSHRMSCGSTTSQNIYPAKFLTR